MQMPIFSLQRSEEYYGQPLEFIPERWVDGAAEETALNRKVPGSWMAFGEGTRSCVGQRFALQEAKITLARLFQRCAWFLLSGCLTVHCSSTTVYIGQQLHTCDVLMQSLW